MKQNWIVYRKKLNGYSCVKHTETDELCIATKHADLWEHSSNKMGCVVFNTYFAKRVAKFLKMDLDEYNTRQSHTEFLFKFDKDLLPEVLKILKYKNNKPSMIKHLENR